MDEEYKFEVGERVRVVNVDGPLHKYYDNAHEYIGRECEVFACDRWTTLNGDNLYLLGGAGYYWFHEWNLEAVGKGFDAKDIIRKAFGLGG